MKQHELALKTHDSISKAQLAEQQQAHAEQQAQVQNQQAAQQQAHTEQQAAVQNQQSQQQMDQQAQQAQAESGQPAPQQPEAQPQDGLHAIQPHEEQVVHQLLQLGFSEQDIEQAMVMLRKGTPLQQIIQTLGAKYQRTKA